MRIALILLVLWAAAGCSWIAAHHHAPQEDLTLTKKLVFENGLYALPPGEHSLVRTEGVNAYYSGNQIIDRAERAPAFTPHIIKVRYGVKTHICLIAESKQYCGIVDNVKNL